MTASGEKGDGSVFSDEKKFKKQNRPLFHLKRKRESLSPWGRGEICLWQAVGTHL